MCLWCVREWQPPGAMMPMLQESMQESVLPFYHVGPRDQTQTAGLGGEHLRLRRYLTGPMLEFLRWQNEAVGGLVVSQGHRQQPVQQDYLINGENRSTEIGRAAGKARAQHEPPSDNI